MKKAKVTVSYLMHQIINVIRSESAHDRDIRKQEFYELLTNMDSNQKQFESKILQSLSESERKLIESIYSSQDKSNSTEPVDASEDIEDSVIVEQDTDNTESVQGTNQEVSTQTPLTSVVVNNKDGETTYNTDNSVVTIETKNQEVSQTEESDENKEQASEAEDQTQEVLAENQAATTEASATTETSAEDKEASIKEEATDKAFFAKVSDGFSSVVSSVTSVGKSVSAVYSQVKSQFEKLWDWLPEIFLIVSAIALTIRGLWRRFKQTDIYQKLSSVVNTLSGLVSSITEGIKKLKDWRDKKNEEITKDVTNENKRSFLQRLWENIKWAVSSNNPTGNPVPGAPGTFFPSLPTDKQEDKIQNKSEPVANNLIEPVQEAQVNSNFIAQAPITPTIQTNTVDERVEKVKDEPTEFDSNTNLSGGNSLFQATDQPQPPMDALAFNNVVNNYNNVTVNSILNGTNVPYC